MDDEIARNSLIGEWETLIALPQCTAFNRPIAAAFTMWQRPVEQSNEVFSQLLFGIRHRFRVSDSGIPRAFTALDQMISRSRREFSPVNQEHKTYG